MNRATKYNAYRTSSGHYWFNPVQSIYNNVVDPAVGEQVGDSVVVMSGEDLSKVEAFCKKQNSRTQKKALFESM